MAGGDEPAQLVKMMERMQTRVGESKKKMELMATTLQILIKDTPTKAIDTYKGNYQNRDKKDNGSTSKEVHALVHWTEYTPIGTMYAQASDNGNIPLGLYDSILAISEYQRKKWDQCIYITSIVESESKMPPHERH